MPDTPTSCVSSSTGRSACEPTMPIWMFSSTGWRTVHDSNKRLAKQEVNRVRAEQDPASTQVPVRAKELSQFRCVEFGLFERCEVPAVLRLGHSGNGRRALQPCSRRAHDVAWEEREA